MPPLTPRRFVEVERLVEEGERSPGTLDTYRHVYRTTWPLRSARCAFGR